MLFPITRTVYLHHIANRNDRIRTCDPLNPDQVLYQTEPHPDICFKLWISSYECTERLRFWVLATASHRVILRTILKKLTGNPYSVSSIIVGREGLEPSVFLMLRIYSPLPSPLGIPTHILLYKTGKSWNRTKSFGFSVQRADTNHTHFPYRTHNKYTFSKNVLEQIAVSVPLLYKSIIFYAYADRDRRSQSNPTQGWVDNSINKSALFYFFFCIIHVTIAENSTIVPATPKL